MRRLLTGRGLTGRLRRGLLIGGHRRLGLLCLRGRTGGGRIVVASHAAIDEQIPRPQERMPGIGEHRLRRLLQPRLSVHVGLFGRGHLDGPLPTLRRWRRLSLTVDARAIPEKFFHEVDARLPTHPPATHKRGAAAGCHQIGDGQKDILTRPCRLFRQSTCHRRLEARQHDASRPLARRTEPIAKRHGWLAALHREQGPSGDRTVARQFVKHEERVDERRHQWHRRRWRRSRKHDRAIDRTGEPHAPFLRDRGFVTANQPPGVDPDGPAGLGGLETQHRETAGWTVADATDIVEPSQLGLVIGLFVDTSAARCRGRFHGRCLRAGWSLAGDGSPRRSNGKQFEWQIPEHAIGHDHEFIDDAFGQFDLRVLEEQAFNPLGRSLPFACHEPLRRHWRDWIEQAQVSGERRDLLGNRRRLPHLPRGNAIMRFKRRLEPR